MEGARAGIARAAGTTTYRIMFEGCEESTPSQWTERRARGEAEYSCRPQWMEDCLCHYIGCDLAFTFCTWYW